MTLGELQEECLKILKEVHSFCVANNIVYSVAYGTLLGAIRHKGFIPWDDDIDIIMPREHYEKFCSTFKSDRYRIKSLLNDKYCYLAFARVYDDEKTYSQSMIPWSKNDGGVWIDVFPADYVPDEEADYKKHKTSLWRRWKAITISRAATVSFDRKKSIAQNGRLLIKKILTVNGYITPLLLKSFIRKATSVRVNSSKHWSQLTCMDGYEWHSIEDFKDICIMPFEDTEVMVMNGYDNVLRDCYGDYMQLPPIEKRIGHSHGLTSFYWK